MTVRSRAEHLLSDALGYEVDFQKDNKRPSKRQQLEHKVEKLEKRRIDRISRGRTRGAGAGGFNRDVDHITHQIRLLELEIAELPDPDTET